MKTATQLIKYNEKYINYNLSTRPQIAFSSIIFPYLVRASAACSIW